MNHGSEQKDRRSRRRFVLLWTGSLVAVALLLAGGAFALTHRGVGSKSNGYVDAGGTGSAPVLDSPPVDAGATPLPSSTARSTTAGSDLIQPREQLTRNAEGGDALVPTPRVTSSAAALGPPREHGASLGLTSTLSAPLRPGAERALYVTVHNPNPFAVNLYRIDVRVDPPAAAGCLATWVSVGRYRYAGGTPRSIDGNANVVVNLPIELVNLVDVDQNACQNTAFPLRLSGMAVDPT